MARGGGGGGRGPMTRDVQVSKKMSWLLRHGAEKEGLVLGGGGYVGVNDVVSFPFLSLLSFLGLRRVCFILGCSGAHAISEGQLAS